VARIDRLKAAGFAAAALVLCVTAGVPAFASPSTVTLADGSSLSVWEQRGRAVPGRGQESSSLGYAVTDVSGIHVGVVPISADAARDTSPFVTIDETGSAVLVWSRFDGSNRKIAYARFSGGAWTNAHYLTFGPADDDEPRIGIDRSGSYLFFAGPGETYLFAPLDLVAGRLFASPKPVPGSAHRDSAQIRAPGSIAIQGGVDAPVTGVSPPDKRSGGSSSTLLKSVGRLTVQSAVDVPVNIQKTKSAIWAVGSGGGCRGIVLVVPSHDLKNASVLRFDDGSAGLLQRVALPGQVAERFGVDLAASYLPFACD
jgi:hypothetical protein